MTFDWSKAQRLDVLHAAVVKEKEKQMTFKVTQSGWYRTRDGRLAEVVCNPKGQDRPCLGYVENELSFRSWFVNGHYHDKFPSADADLVEYLGKERPKQKKVVRMAPSLLCDQRGYYLISDHIHDSEKKARDWYKETFVRWLIDTPYAIDVEVPDNG